MPIVRRDTNAGLAQAAGVGALSEVLGAGELMARRRASIVIEPRGDRYVASLTCEHGTLQTDCPARSDGVLLTEAAISRMALVTHLRQRGCSCAALLWLEHMRSPWPLVRTFAEPDSEMFEDADRRVPASELSAAAPVQFVAEPGDSPEDWRN